jgi:pilus assembly protein Flp/PilA
MDDRTFKMGKLKRSFKKEEGVTSIEYALIAMLIAMGIIGAVTLIGTSLQNSLDAVDAALP